MDIQIVVNDSVAIADLEKIKTKVSDLGPFLLAVGDKVTDQFRINFSQAPWTPLAAATLARKQAEGFPMDILVRSGDMKMAAESGSWELEGNNKAVLGVPGYSTFHFEGTEFMPARDYAFLPDSFPGVVAQVFAEYISA